jgi:hypothetical protein
MSGGAFDYQQYRLEDISREIGNIIRKQGEDDGYGGTRAIYALEIQAKMTQTMLLLNVVADMVQRIDWLVSGDDGEESFIRRWREEEIDDRLKDMVQDHITNTGKMVEKSCENCRFEHEDGDCVACYKCEPVTKSWQPKETK